MQTPLTVFRQRRQVGVQVLLLLPKIAAAPLLGHFCCCRCCCCCSLLVLDCWLIVGASITKDVVILIHRRRGLPGCRPLQLPSPSTHLFSCRCCCLVLELAVHLDAVLLQQSLPLPPLQLLLAAACGQASQATGAGTR